MDDLNVTSPEILDRAGAIDRASELLILDAAQAGGSQHAGADTVGWARSAATAELINYALASGGANVSTLLRPAPPPTRRAASPGRNA
jgi:hypothetical protein